MYGHGVQAVALCMPMEGRQSANTWQALSALNHRQQLLVLLSKQQVLQAAA